MLSNRTLAISIIGVALLFGTPKSASAISLPEINIPKISVPQVDISSSNQTSRTSISTSSNTNVQITTTGEGTTEVTQKGTTSPTQTTTHEQTPQQQSVTTQSSTPTPTPWWYRLLRPTATKTPTPTPTKTDTQTPATQPTTTPTPTNSISQTISLLDSKQQFMLDAINAYRKKNGLGSVQADKYTCSFAAIRATEIVGNFNHDGFTERRDNRTMPYPGYSLITENIAMTSNYQNVVNMWINSPGHAANMRKDTPYVCVAYAGNYYAYEGWKP